jgi:putative thioredoxin
VRSSRAVITIFALLISASFASAQDDIEVEDPGAALREALEQSLDPAPGASDAAESPEGDPSEPAAADAEGSPATKLNWRDDVAAAQRAAQFDAKPLLIRFTAPWCGWCRVQEKAFADAEVARELETWTLAVVDIDRDPGLARKYGVSGVPAWRAVASSGGVAAKVDGYLEPAKLIEWLKSSRRSTSASSPAVLTSTAAPDFLDVTQLIDHLGDRDPATRQLAIVRLTQHPEKTRKAVLDSVTNGNLATRLAALEVLRRWKAPLDEFDPWQPETFAPERLERLTIWAQSVEVDPNAPPLDEAALADARAQLDALADATDEEAHAILIRLSGMSAALLPEVYYRLKQAEGDAQRRRLTELRYRLLASGKLRLAWSEGLAALASDDSALRRQSADALIARAQAEDQPLLLELISDPDALVREIVLRGLRDLGGEASATALARLLKDPEANVRAAVLKQLAESPPAAVMPHIAKYVAEETDADLLVHAARVLRGSRSAIAAEALLTLADHESWQVRTEVAEALSESVDRGIDSLPDDLQSSIHKTLLDMLGDSDGFVVSRALKGVAEGGAPPVEPLVGVIEKHPDLALEIIPLLARSERAAEPHLRRFFQHENAAVRAGALAGLFQVLGTDVSAEVLTGLKDDDPRVRLQAMHILFDICERERPDPNATRFEVYENDHVRIVEEKPRTLFGGLLQLLGGGEAPPSNEGRPPEPDFDEPPDPPGHKEEQWLAEFRAGQGRPEWMNEIVELVAADLKAESRPLRLQAALCLLPVETHSEEAITALHEMLAAEPGLASDICPALPWLIWEERLRMFNAILTAGEEPPTYSALRYFTIIPNPKAIDRLWELLADADLDPYVPSSIWSRMREVYFANSWDPSEASQRDRDRAAADARRWIEQGRHWQPTMGLALLNAADKPAAQQVAEKLYADPAQPKELRADALRVILVSSTAGDARRTALAALETSERLFQHTALAFLAHGSEAVDELSDALSLDRSSHVVYSSSGELSIIVPEAPKGLTKEVLKELRQSDDAEIAGYAAYFLVMLGDNAQLDPLIEYWRSRDVERYSDAPWQKLVYRAIALANATDRAPVLEELYKTYYFDSYRAREFYWTIRIMTGREVLLLRKKIRDEVGMDNLQ